MTRNVLKFNYQKWGVVMANISYFMLFDQLSNVQLPDGQVAMQFTNPQPVLRPQFIPGNYSFAYCLAVRGVDFSKENTVCVRIEDPDCNVVYKMGEMKSPIAGDEGNLPPEYKGFGINANMHNFAFEKKGVYHLIITINGEDLDPAEIPVFLREEK